MPFLHPSAYTLSYYKYIIKSLIVNSSAKIFTNFYCNAAIEAGKNIKFNKSGQYHDRKYCLKLPLTL